MADDAREIVIRLFGEPQIVGLPSPALFPRKGFLLLALLAAAPSNRMRRNEVASILWEHFSSEMALTNLRQLLVRTRRILETHSQLLVVDSLEIALGEDSDLIDVCAFKAHVDSVAIEQMFSTMALFRGELLTGIEEPGEQYFTWINTERSILRENYLALASRYLIGITRYGRASKPDLSKITERMIGAEPEREATYRVAIEAYGRCGMFDEVDRLFLNLKKMLTDEYKSLPSAETLAVVRRASSRRNNPGIENQEQNITLGVPRVAFFSPQFIGDQRYVLLVKMLFEDIANELGSYHSFHSLAPHSSFGVSHDGGIPMDNSRLRVDYSVSGFLRPDRSEDELSLRLANCVTGEVVWSGRFGTRPRDLLKSFGLLSSRIAASLATALERDLIGTTNRTGDPSAYFYYLEGQQHLINCDLVRLRRARKSYIKSIELNPMAAHAKARIAQTLYLEWIQLGGNDPQLLANARMEAKSAISANPNDVMGHLMEATVALYQRDFDMCEQKFSEAETITPNSPDLLIQYADALAHLGDCDGAWRRYERAIDLNPSPPDHYWWAGASIAFCKEDYQQVIQLCSKLQSDDSVLGIVGSSHAFLGDKEKALSYGNRIKEIYPGMTGEDRVNVVPDRNNEYRDRRLAGLKMMGIN